MSELHEECHGGGCLCGAVRYEVRGELRPALFCHCQQCQRSHGVPPAYSAARDEQLRLTGEDSLAWYQSSPQARRGFCRTCGASLFWQHLGSGYIAITCGSLDPPSGVQAVGHIFVASKGDYYEIHDGLPQYPEGTGGAVPGVAV